MFYREKILKKFYENAAKKFKSHELFTNSINFYSLWQLQKISLNKIGVKFDNEFYEKKNQFLFRTYYNHYENFKVKNSASDQFKKITILAALLLLIIYTDFREVFTRIKQQLDQKKQQKSEEQIEREKKDKPKVKFEDVLGIDEYKEEIEDVLDFLKNPKKYYKMGCNMTKGILLTGPPGVGKTLLAKALANEANCNFIRVSGSDFDQIYVGSGQQKVQKIFKQARKQQPSIIFIDEFDSVGGKRVMDHEFYRGTLNQLLAEMDGFQKTDKVIVIAATNLPDSLDPAIKRSGRFDKQVSIPYPSFKSRKLLLNYYLNKVKYNAQQIDVDTIANITTGFTGADIKNLINQSAFESIRQGRTQIVQNDLELAFDRIVMGLNRKSMFQTEEQKLKTAYHEAGHALMSLYKKGNAKLHKVTILPRGQALGFTSFIPEKDNSNYNKEQLLGSLMSALGGRAAEEIMYGNDNITSGCGSDLVKATQIAYQMMAMYGMVKEDYLLNQDLQNLSDEVRNEIDTAVQDLVKDKYKETLDTLQQNAKHLELLARELVEKETLSQEQVLKLLNIN